MKPHTDEPLTGGSRAKTRKGSLSRKGVRRCGIVAAALSAAVLLSSCMPQGAVTEKRADQLSVGDAVIAVRLSEGKFSAGLPDPPEDNWIVLLDAQGRGQATRIEAKRYGFSTLLWTERGLSFGAPDKEYVTTDQGTQEIDVKQPSISEYQRFLLPDGRIAVVALGEGIRVDTIHPHGRIETTEIPDTRGEIGQCGQHIVGITDTEDSESIRSAAFEAYAAQSGGDMPDFLDSIGEKEKTRNPAVFQVSETGVYVLEQNDDEDVLTLSYQPWDGGGKRVLLTTGTMSRYLVERNLLMGYRRSIESFALRPGWDGGAQ